MTRPLSKSASSPLVVKQSREIPVGVEQAFGMLPMPLTDIFRRWYGPIPPIKQVLGQDGEWGTVGQARTVKLVGGGSMLETLTRVDAPRSFEYQITDVKGPLAPLVGRIEGVWSFDPVGEGTDVGWQWTIHPRSSVSALALPVFGRLWRGYAR